MGGFIFCIGLLASDPHYSKKSVPELVMMAPLVLIIFFPLGMAIAFFSPVAVPIAILGKMNN